MPVDIDRNAFARVFSRVQLDNPHLLQLPRGFRVKVNVRTGMVVSVRLQYTITRRTYNRMIARMNRRADAIITRARRQDRVVDQIRVIHDQLLRDVRYADAVPNAHNAYGVLVGRRGVCEAFSRAFQFVCQRMGIPVLLVTGFSREPHMWNMVRVGRRWWHIDVTWNFPIDQHGRHRITYDFFLLSDRDIQRTHIIYPVAGRAHGLGNFNFYRLPRTPANTRHRIAA